MTIAVSVATKSKKPGITLRDGIYRVAVTAAPEQGKANDAVRRILAKHFHVKTSSVIIKRGHSSKKKVIEIHDA